MKKTEKIITNCGYCGIVIEKYRKYPLCPLHDKYYYAIRAFVWSNGEVRFSYLFSKDGRWATTKTTTIKGLLSYAP